MTPDVHSIDFKEAHMRTKTNLIALAVMAAFGAVAGSAIAAPSSTTDPSSTSPSTGTYGSPSSGSMGSSTAPDASAPSSGSAAAPNPANDAEFAKLDKDHKGYITKKDAAKNKELAKKFDTLDMNKDGKLDQAEFAQFEVAPAGKTAK
jgi:hypothetical protein